MGENISDSKDWPCFDGHYIASYTDLYQSHVERFDAMVTGIIVIIQILEMRIKDDLPRSSFFF